MQCNVDTFIMSQWLLMLPIEPKHPIYCWRCPRQGGFDGRRQPTASPMLTAIMSGGVGISGRELYKYR